MKNLKRGSIKYLVCLIIFFDIVSVILYPLFDLFLCKFITNSPFVYNVNDYVVEPLLYGTIMALVYWVFDKKFNIK